MDGTDTKSSSLKMDKAICMVDSNEMFHQGDMCRSLLSLLVNGDFEFLCVINYYFYYEKP